jgi:trimethylamine--corrinoid protein Co-methyltransferase
LPVHVVPQEFEKLQSRAFPMGSDPDVRPRLTLLSSSHIEAVHEGSLRLLRELGLRVDSERARRVLARAGTRIEGDRVYFERDVVEWAIRVSPPSIDVFDRRGREAFRLGEGQGRTRFGTGVTNLWYQDPATDELFPFHREHMVAGVRLSQTLPSYDVISTLGVLRDLPPSVADLYAVLEMVANSTKPLVLLISDERLFPTVLELLDTLHGDAGAKPFVIPYLNPITPLSINEGTSDKLLDSIDRGIPAIYSNYGMAGMTTPITCAGTLAFLNAELLAGLVLSQLAREGAPVILGSLPMFFEMKHVVDFYDPQSFLINLACAEMMAHYRLPHAGTSGSGEGYGPDLPAAATQWMNQVTSVLGRVGLAPFVGSSLNSKAFSPALTVYGDEVIGQARLFASGFTVDEASIGVDEAIAAMKQEGHFLMTPTTLERYQTATFASMFPHIGLEKWQEERPRAELLLRERTRDLMAEVEPPEDHDDLLARGQAFIGTWERRGA